MGILVCLSWYLHDLQILWPLDEPAAFGMTRLHRYDQEFYMEYAQLLASPQREGILPRSRMPFYPWLMSFLYDATIDYGDLIERYKLFNCILSILILAGVFFVFKRWAGRGLAALITCITAFNFFVSKAVLIQPELLFYFSYLLVFVLMCRHLGRPDWKSAGLVGLLSGVTHLQKGSALPMFVLFLVLCCLQAVFSTWPESDHEKLSAGCESPPPPPMEPLAIARCFRGRFPRRHRGVSLEQLPALRQPVS